MSAMNGKRPSTMPSRHQPEICQPEPVVLAQHFDLIKYIYDSWNSVSRELDMCHNQPHSNTSNYRNGASVTYYQEREPNPQLKGILSRSIWRRGGDSVLFKVSLGMRVPSARPNMSTIIGHFQIDTRNRRDKLVTRKFNLCF
ncbi:uncharacterized protein LOC105185570 isoform X2 [Harpegnathos saltator]|nr:uncharacterized protein LOC105185570 isoform X2 [Harpegnathos saltator]